MPSISACASMISPRLGADRNSLQPERQLVIALFIATVSVFVFGLALMPDKAVLTASFPIFLVCLMIVAIIGAVATATGSLGAGFVVACLALLLVLQLDDYAFVVFFGLAAISVALLVVNMRGGASWSLRDSLFVGGATAVSVLGCRGAYTSFDMWQRLQVGNIHPDTLFHSSIAAMIKNYGIASTGVHGLSEINYHTLSHQLIAGISKLSGVSVIETYGIAPAVLFAPVLIMAIVGAAIHFVRGRHDVSVVWLVVCLLLSVFPVLFSKWALWDSYFVSESYLVALCFFVFSLPSLYKSNLSFSAVVVAVLMGIMAAAAKLSVGLILLGLWAINGILFARLERLRVAVVVVALGLYFWVFMFDVAADASRTASFLSFVVKYSYWGRELGTVLVGQSVSLLSVAAIVSFLMFHNAASVSCLLLLSRSNSASMIGLDSRNRIGIYVSASVIAGVIPGLVFDIPGGSAYYFSNVAFFVALPPLVVLSLLGLRQLKSKRCVSMGWIVAVGLFLGFGGFSMAAKAKHHSKLTSSENDFVVRLASLRSQSPINSAYRLLHGSDDLSMVRECWARPFVYVAVSERPWVDTIRRDETCSYDHYGFSDYGVAGGNTSAIVQPKMISGMTVFAFEP